MAEFTVSQRALLDAISRAENPEDAVRLCISFLDESNKSGPKELRTLEDLLSGLLLGGTYPENQIHRLCHTCTGQSEPLMMLWVSPETENSFRQTLSQVPDFWCVSYQKLLVGLASGPDATNSIEKLVQKHNLTAGMSRPFSDLQNLRQYYRQALITMLTAQAFNHSGLSFYDDYLMLRLFDGLREDVDVNDFALPDVQVLREYDKQHDTELCKTLLCYVESSKNVNITAKKLNVHRNTVHYRIGKCRELLSSLDFDNSYISFLLMLSLYIAQYDFYLENKDESLCSVRF